MAIVSLEKIRLKNGGQPWLKSVSLKVDRGDRIVIVGRSGSAETPLLDLFAGRLAPERGKLLLESSAQIGYMRKDPGLGERATVLEAALSGCAELIRLRKSIDRLQSAQDGNDQRQMAQLAEQRERYENEGGDDLERRATLALENLGFDTAQFDQQVGLLSGGERSRLSLAQVLVMDTDLLLLDEPTVHLDLRGTEFLEQHLADFAGAAVVVTHDRSFIDRFATRIAAVEADGSLSLHAKLADQLRSAAVEPTDEPIFSRVEESGKMVFVANKLSLSPGGRELLTSASFKVGRGERVGIIGPCGSGKSVLLKTLAGEVTPDGGKLHTGSNALMGIYEQDRTGLDATRSFGAELKAACPNLSKAELITVAKAFLFDEEDFTRPVDGLDSAEAARLRLACLVQGETNVLLLDEPTAQLDIPAREGLERALSAYPGTVLVVSRDRALLDHVAQRILSIEGSGLVDAQGVYSELRGKGEIMVDVPRTASVAGLTGRGKKRKACREPEQAVASESKPLGRVEDLRAAVAEQAKAIEALQAKLSSPKMALDWEGLERLSAEKKSLQAEYDSNRAALARLEGEK
jgi:ATPase subunit of ABC transporter with duplicated ATPase domains